MRWGSFLRRGLEHGSCGHSFHECMDLYRQGLPALSEVTDANIDTFKVAEKVVVIGFISKSDKAHYSVLESVSNNLRDSYLFGIVSDDVLAKRFGVTSPGVILFKKFDEGENRL